MSKLYVQNFPEVLNFSGSVGAACLMTGSLRCLGYSQLVGFITSSGSCETGSGLNISQSVNAGSVWDINSGSNAWATSFSAACTIDVLGDYIRVYYKNGATKTSNLRLGFWLKPVAGTAPTVMPSASTVVSSGSVVVTSGSIDILKSGSVVVTTGCLSSACMQPFDSMTTTTAIPLVETDDAITGCQLGKSASYLFSGRQSGEFLSSTFLYSPTGATANDKSPGGYVYFFSGCPTIIAGCTTIAASDYSNVFGRVKVETSDWDKGSACYGAAYVCNQPVAFPAASKLWFAFKLTSSACFNDAAGDDEKLDMILTYRRDS